MALVFAATAPAEAGPLEDATAAYERGDYATALQLIRPLADQGDAPAQINLGAMYGDGRGVAQAFDLRHAVTLSVNARSCYRLRCSGGVIWEIPA